MNSSVILFKTHFYTKEIIAEFNKISTECTNHDVINLHDSGKIPASTEINKSFALNENDLRKRYAGFQSLWNDAHLPLVYFFEQHSSYEYYWMIEYDVRFNGNWSHFINAFATDKTDFLGAHLYTTQSNPHYSHWNVVSDPNTIPYEDRVCLFFPVIRVSNKALSVLSEGCRKGLGGYCEVISPSYVRKHNFTIGDFNGRRVPGPNTESQQWLSYATFRYRPTLKKMGSRKNWLYHPVLEHKSLKDFIKQIRYELFDKHFPKLVKKLQAFKSSKKA